MVVTGIAVVWTLVVLGFLWAHRGVLLANWREPALRVPVLIVESDDWGPGPARQCEQLDALHRLLAEYSDCRTRHPVMTLGVILAIPDRRRMSADNEGTYYRLTLGDPKYAPIRSVMLAGAKEGVFALQLHGMEHFWPDALVKSAAHDQNVKAWLSDDNEPATEALPPTLQSRWVDASRLPSMAIPDADVEEAVSKEVETFTAVFESTPTVVVPPTFIWDSRVEAAWAAKGVRVVVTPGRRHETRSADGGLQSNSGAIRNGEKGAEGIVYVVRDDYFEPMFGHRAEKGFAAFQRKTRLGRPTLLEMHRANFIGDAELAERARGELRGLLSLVVERCPSVRFMATEELASAITTDGSDLVEARLHCRIAFWLRRLNTIPRLRRFGWLSGIAILASPLHMATFVARQVRSHIG